MKWLIGALLGIGVLSVVSHNRTIEAKTAAKSDSQPEGITISIKVIPGSSGQGQIGRGYPGTFYYIDEMRIQNISEKPFSFSVFIFQCDSYSTRFGESFGLVNWQMHTIATDGGISTAYVYTDTPIDDSSIRKGLEDEMTPTTISIPPGHEFVTHAGDLRCATTNTMGQGISHIKMTLYGTDDGSYHQILSTKWFDMPEMRLAPRFGATVYP